MIIRVRFYSQLRDLAGTPELEVEVPDDAKVNDLLRELYREKPALRAQDNTILIGAGVAFVDRDYALKAGEEISIMPPVQGG